MRNTLLILSISILVIISNGLHAQTDCSGNRYSQQIFTEVDSAVNIKYGQNFKQDGVTNEDLYLDVYFPKNDNDNSRPLILLAHGGSFVSGDKADMSPVCRALAKMGYVVVTINYRLLVIGIDVAQDIPGNFKKEVVRAMHDMKAAIRYMRQTAANGNPYGINPNVVIAGGMSAGAIMSNHLTYMNTMAKIPSDLVTYVQQQGGIEGNSGNPGYSSIPQMNLSMCGAILDTVFVESGMQPFYGVHTMDDQTVPPLFGQPYILNMTIPIDLYGDSLIFKRAQNQGVASKYRNYATGGHCGFMNDAGFFADMTNFMHEQVCLENLAIDNNPDEILFSIYPNPANTKLTIDIPGNQWTSVVRIIDVTGKLVYSTSIQQDNNVSFIDISNLNSGIYQLRITTNDGRTKVKKFIKE